MNIFVSMNVVENWIAVRPIQYDKESYLRDISFKGMP